MPVKALKKDLYYVGVLNPNLRIFDIVMSTDYGTTYNSYIIKDEKTALIEASHRSFSEEFLDNIKEVTSLRDINYIVLNHTEPDHSGMVRDLIRLCPNAEIVCTKAASIYLNEIINDTPFSPIIVKDGDSISLGKYNLDFISAPFLHWPDTMFTYCKELLSVFTCDFLGAHYCEPRIMDTKLTYSANYKASLDEYFMAIFSPFKSYVQDGLKKLNNLEYNTVCTSHGPVLTKSGLLDYAIERYEQLSAIDTCSKLNIPIFYSSAYGFTRRLAEEARRTIAEEIPDAVTTLYDLTIMPIDQCAQAMNSSDAFMIGSPTLNKDAVPPIWNLLSHIDAINSVKKPVGVFGSYGWSGEAIGAIIGRLKPLRVNIIGEGLKINFYPSMDNLEAMRAYTREFIAAIL